jgi:hypothetical protein
MGAVGVASVMGEWEPPPPRLPSRGTEAVVCPSRREREGRRKTYLAGDSHHRHCRPLHRDSRARCAGRHCSLAVYGWG